MFSLIKSGVPFYSKKFLDALLELDLQTSNPKLYPNSLDTLLLKTEEDKLIPVGNKDYVDYRSISDRKRDIADILIESDYKGVIIDSIKFDEVQALQESIVGSNLSVKLLKGDISVLLDIPETYEEYLSNLSKKNRHELKRKLKKFQREFPEYEISFGSNEDHFATFIDLHRNSSKEKKEFMTDEVESFFAHLLKIKGWKIYILWVNKEAVAALDHELQVTKERKILADLENTRDDLQQERSEYNADRLKYLSQEKTYRVQLAKLEAIDRNKLGDKITNIESITDTHLDAIKVQQKRLKLDSKVSILDVQIEKLNNDVKSQEGKIEQLLSDG